MTTTQSNKNSLASDKGSTMGLTVRIEFPHFPDGVPRKGARRRILKTIADGAVTIITARNEVGIDINGKPYKKPYTKAWEKFKIRTNRIPYSDGDWHIYTGQMMASLGIMELSSSHFIVGFQGSRPPIDMKKEIKAIEDEKSRTKKAKKPKRGIPPKAPKSSKPKSTGPKRPKKPRRRRVRFEASDPKDKMIDNALIAMGNDRIRPFIGLSTKEKDQLVKDALEFAQAKGWF